MQSFVRPYILATGIVLLAVVIGAWFGVSTNRTATMVLEPDTFAYEGVIANRTEIEVYSWDNRNDRAVISWRGVTHGGTATVTIRDPTERTMFQQTFDVDSKVSNAGTRSGGREGRWTIEIVFKDYSGDIRLGGSASNN